LKKNQGIVYLFGIKLQRSFILGEKKNAPNRDLVNGHKGRPGMLSVQTAVNLTDRHQVDFCSFASPVNHNSIGATCFLS